MSDLSNFVVSGQSETIDIPIYYKIKAEKGHKKIIIIDDDKAAKMIEAKDTELQTLNTKWKYASWKDQNKIVEASNKEIDIGRSSFNWILYRDLRLKAFLIDWDLDHNGKKIDVNAANIDKLPNAIALAMYEKYEKYTSLDSEDQKK